MCPQRRLLPTEEPRTSAGSTPVPHCRARRGWPRTARSRRPRGGQAAAAGVRRHRLRRPLAALALPLRRRHLAGRALPDRPGAAAGRRCGAHPPAARRAGAQLGIQDAFNLGWKLFRLGPGHREDRGWRRTAEGQKLGPSSRSAYLEQRGRPKPVGCLPASLSSVHSAVRGASRGDAVRLRVAMRRFRQGGGVFGAGRVFRRR